ncbi:MAG: hypothetical protein NC302_08235 [Bacteroidales bacterium]|nr:hypothetical protein [Bacteroidales bacterium]MCM1415115.1 hypothetical protein [bacterium]MCM1423805.1 hypothetical protein [bacterium]
MTALRREAIQLSPKMKTYQELEKMIVPLAQDIDYDRELAEARDEKYDIRQNGE